MDPAPLLPLFVQVGPEQIHGGRVDGAWRVRVDLPGAVGGDTLLRLTFVHGRIGPHHLRVDGARVVRLVKAADPPGTTDADSWNPIPGTATYDALVPPGVTSVTIRWAEPAEGARLVRLGRAVAPVPIAQDMLDGGTLWHADATNTDLAHWRAGVQAVDADPARSAEQKRASRFWLSLDLATSLADPQTQGEEVADALGIAPELVVVDPLRRKWLTELLQVRWMHRACCASAGVPPELLLSGFRGQGFELAQEVVELFLALIHKAFEPADAALTGCATRTDPQERTDCEARVQLEAAALPIVQFACGSLRRPGAGQRLNVEPNSFAMASFAEVVDLAALDYENVVARRRQEYDSLRALFVAMLKPFAEIYAPPPGPNGGDRRRADRYRFENLGREPGAEARGRWTDAALQSHVQQVMAMDRASLAAHWGAVLASALAAEPLVIKSGRWRREHLDGKGGAGALADALRAAPGSRARETYEG